MSRSPSLPGALQRRVIEGGDRHGVVVDPGEVLTLAVRLAFDGGQT